MTFGGAGGTDDDIGMRQMFGKFVPRDGLGGEALRQFFGACHRAVGHEHLAHPLPDEVAGRQLRGLAGAEHHDGMPSQVLEDFLRQLHRGVADGHGVVADTGLTAGGLGDVEGAFKEVMEDGAGSAGVTGGVVGGFHLAEDLRLAEHHGVEAGGDAKQVAHRLQLVQMVEAGDKVFPCQGVIGGHEALTARGAGRRVAALHVELHPVAGGQDDQFLDLRRPERRQGVGQRGVGKRQAFAHGHRRRRVVEANQGNRHASQSSSAVSRHKACTK